MSNPLEELLNTPQPSPSNSMVWGTITSLGPITVSVGPQNDLITDIEILIDEASLEIGDRVYISYFNRKMVIVGKLGGPPPPEPPELTGVLGLSLRNGANQTFASNNDRAAFSEVERNDGFTLVYSGANVVAFRPPQDGWYMATGAIMRPSSGTFTILYGLAPHPMASNNTDYLAGGYFAGSTYFLIDFAQPVYLYKDQEYCAKTYGSAAWTSQPTAGSPVYNTRLSVISIDSDAIGIPGPQGPEGPPGPPGGGLLQRSGLIPVIPASIDKTGAGSQARMSSLGMVEFEDCNNISLNGVFTEDFDAYRVIAQVWHRGNVGSGPIYLRMRSAGVDYTTAHQVHRSTYTNNAGTVAGSANTAASALQIGWIASDGPSTRNSYSLDLHGPYLADDLSFSGTFSTYVSGVVGGYIPDPKSYDGLTLSMFTGASSQISGTVQVFGYAKGEF